MRERERERERERCTTKKAVKKAPKNKTQSMPKTPIGYNNHKPTQNT